MHTGARRCCVCRRWSASASLFEKDGYRKLWLARLLSSIPVNAIVYTMLILVVNATGKSFASSLFVVAYIAPSALLGTISGAMVDHMPKGIVLAGTNAVRAGLCVLLALSTDNVLVIYIIAVVFAVGSQFSGPAEGAALPAVVEPDEYASANSVNNLGSLISQIVGLMILPTLFLWTVGAAPLAIVCAVMFALAAVAFMSIPGLGGPISTVDVTIARDARALRGGVEPADEGLRRLHQRRDAGAGEHGGPGRGDAAAALRDAGARHEPREHNLRRGAGRDRHLACDAHRRERLDAHVAVVEPRRFVRGDARRASGCWRSSGRSATRCSG